MRIISGRAKGMRLISPPTKDQRIRPTSDRCKEALFSIIAPQIEHSRVLDLFAGTGSLGYEALSRGARSAVFIDNGSLPLNILRKNRDLLARCFNQDEILPEITIIKGDLLKSLVYLLNKCKSTSHGFDIVFLDPPYDKGFAQLTLQQFDTCSLLAKDGIIIAEERSDTELQTEFKSLELVDKRKYGDSGFWIFKNTMQP